MVKQSSSGITYEDFATVWKQLMEEGRANDEAAHDILGGSRSTIEAFREQYERENAFPKKCINDLEIIDAMWQAIETMKAKEIELLESTCQYLMTIKKIERKHADAVAALDGAKLHFDAEKLKLIKQLVGSRKGKA